ncbi:DUF3127 domain-containing protein [Flavobacterium facile]|uniref:DUF3127 domain-containing protein n=1 Tax=Flavobacterium facile TaxID=2893174 RepID=UPI002E7774DC|nr:DUF3127 domain-containing protein [Flavobacterium sp. T-12]
MEVVAKIVRIKDTQEVGQKNFKIRNVHVTTEEQYPQTLEIQFVQDKTAELDNYKAGDKVRISVNLKGKEVTKENGDIAVYNTIGGWKIEKLAQ